MRLLEICCGDIGSVQAAYDGGADRVELCSGLEVGGLTPSIGFVERAVMLARKDSGRGFAVNVLIRPRPGDFLYDAQEVEVMLRDIKAVVDAGADGVVIGALDAEGEIDVDTMHRLIDAANGADITLHRAFDLCCNPERALTTASELGCRRILTSGCAQRAVEGLALIKKLVDRAPCGLKIMAGSGINAANVGKILSDGTVAEVHASARELVLSSMKYRREGVSMGTEGDDEYGRRATSAEIVRQLAEIVKNHG